MLGRFSNNKRVGVHWRKMEGNLWLVGEVDEATGQMDGEVVVLYPDLTTVLAAQFCAGKMVVGRQGSIGGVSKHLGVPWPQVIDLGRDREFSYQPSTSNCISPQPLLRYSLTSQYFKINKETIFSEVISPFRDPYEQDQVYVALSRVR